MKKQIKYILTLSLVLIAGISCKKEYLTAIPPTTVSDATAFDTPERILGNVRSMYLATKGGAFYAGRYIVYGDIRGEDFLNETGNIVTGADVWALNAPGTSTNSVINLWRDAYYAINLCNITIEGVTAKGPSVLNNPTLMNNYLGEARYLRALCYYSLLQYYARPYADGAGNKPGLPLRLTGIKGSGFSDLARSSVAQVYAQIITDLNFAEANLPASYTVTAAAENTTRAHRNTAIALKTRVYLSMGDYANVITEGTKLAPQLTAPFSATSGVLHALQPNIATVFSAYNTTESIQSFPMSAAVGDNPGTQNQLGFYFVRNLTNPGTAEYSLNPAGIIGDLTGWPAADARRTLTFFNAATNKRFVFKYQQPSPFLDWAPVIRYSEVLLNLAEALARRNSAGDAAKATALLNAVRQRSDASVTLAPANQAALIAAILLERRIEFLGEGLRNNDLMRLLQTIPAKGSVPAKAPTDQGYIWPISATEMSLNKLMIDN